MPSNTPTAATELRVTCRVPTSELCYVRFTLEAYEGLCLPTTLPGGEGRLRLSTGAGQRGPLQAALAALAEELPLVVEQWSTPPDPEDADVPTPP